MNPLVGAGETEEVRRPLSVYRRFYSFLYGVLVTFYTLFLEPVFDLLAFSIPRGARRLIFGALMQWLPIYGSERVPSGSNGRVKSKNLVTECLIGKGFSGIFYETMWLGCSPGSSGRRLARKDFPGVKGEIFEREAIPLFELPDHPNLLKTLCWTVDSRSCSLVMEYMRDDLSSVVRRKKEELRKKQQVNQPGIMGRRPAAPFELHEVLEIAIQIATGMENLHLTGITHGDLKTNNIFIDWKEDKMLVKLTDFGLLETKRRSTMVSQRAFCFEMLEWSAPELFEDYFRSTSEDLDYLWTKSLIGLERSTSSVSTFEKYPEISMAQADSYSFALICAFVLGGQMWNAKLSPSELRREISTSGLRPKLPSECPETLRSLISLCWDANPARRPNFSYILKKLQEEQWNLREGEEFNADLSSSLETTLVPEEPLFSRESIPSVLIQRENEEFDDFQENQDAFDDSHENHDSYSYFYEDQDSSDDFHENHDSYSYFYEDQDSSDDFHENPWGQAAQRVIRFPENPRVLNVDQAFNNFPENPWRQAIPAFNSFPENPWRQAIQAFNNFPENPWRQVVQDVDDFPENRRGQNVQDVNDYPENPLGHVNSVETMLEYFHLSRRNIIFPQIELELG